MKKTHKAQSTTEVALTTVFAAIIIAIVLMNYGDNITDAMNTTGSKVENQSKKAAESYCERVSGAWDSSTKKCKYGNNETYAQHLSSNESEHEKSSITKDTAETSGSMADFISTIKDDLYEGYDADTIADAYASMVSGCSTVDCVESWYTTCLTEIDNYYSNHVTTSSDSQWNSILSGSNETAQVCVSANNCTDFTPSESEGSLNYDALNDVAAEILAKYKETGEITVDCDTIEESLDDEIASCTSVNCYLEVYYNNYSY